MTWFPERLARAASAGAADLVEMFSAIQGEGTRVGERHLFVRFMHCDMRCVYCDTPSCHVELPEFRLELAPGERRFERRANPVAFSDLSALIGERLDAGVPHSAVSFTGGEPLLQPEAILATVPEIHRRGVAVLLETDANLPAAFECVRDVVDVLSMDWKLASATGEPCLADAHRAILGASGGIECYVKAVYVEETSIDEVLEAARAVAELRPDVPLILQPVSPFGSVRRSPSAQKALTLQAAALKVHRHVRVVPQVHRLMGQL